MNARFDCEQVARWKLHTALDTRPSRTRMVIPFSASHHNVLAHEQYNTLSLAIIRDLYVG